MADELDYLSADFDLNSLTVPRLRSILVSHDISYPASAKKAQLIRILEEEVLPQAKNLLRERERVKRTSDGITDMGSRATSVVSDFGDRNRDSMPPPPTPSSVSTATGARRGRSRVSTRGSTADTEERHMSVTPATTSKKTPARSTANKNRLSDLEAHHETPATPTIANTVTPRKSTARKLRRSDMTPSTEPEPALPSIKKEPRDENVFTDDNPFQSGSSPVPWDQKSSVKSDRKRKSTSRVLAESPAFRRSLHSGKSDLPPHLDDGEAVASTRSSLGSPFPKSRPPKIEDSESDESEFDAGEEFTPDEQLALEREQAERMYAPKPSHRRPKKQGKFSRAAPWLVILSLFTSFGAWWRKEKIEMGFCGIGKPTWSLSETKVPEWAEVLEPQCEPCPPHAFCYPNFEVRCEHDFLLKAHPLSLGGLIPLPPTCEPDSEKARRVKAVADKAIEQLRDRRAKWECGELADVGKETAGPEISEPELREEVGKKRRKGMSDAEFDDLWKGALGEIIAKEEVVSKTKQPSSVLTLTSTSISRLPLSCAFRRHVRLSLLAYRLPLSILILCMSALVYARSRVLARRSDLARVPELVATTLDRLATQAALHARGDAREPYIPIGQLRDDVLRTELRGNRREELWKRVLQVVEENANIRAAVREGRGGDVARVWEWIGGISIVRGDQGASKPHALESPSAAPEDHVQLVEPKDLAEKPKASRRWDEGRPIY
ncbi:inner nuclear membrane protein enriched at telomere/subtelomere region [Aspergillus nanangensis]|uniref:Inner nuclear membrane protein enriched at telomere/subtelomere region n=1 Tax=Aspergillus nanangensis TaxID=2582783 RepID=A0AAD4CML9_ASPNN|nr:inner nuclear membrane protein enriched at telomere/subtelomere region [Aspergillus nanangensis]